MGSILTLNMSDAFSSHVDASKICWLSGKNSVDPVQTPLGAESDLRLDTLLRPTVLNEQGKCKYDKGQSSPVCTHVSRHRENMFIWRKKCKGLYQTE